MEGTSGGDKGIISPDNDPGGERERCERARRTPITSKLVWSKLGHFLSCYLLDKWEVTRRVMICNSDFVIVSSYGIVGG